MNKQRHLDKVTKADVIIHSNTWVPYIEWEKMWINERPVKMTAIWMTLEQFIDYQKTDVKDKIKFLMENNITNLNY